MKSRIINVDDDLSEEVENTTEIKDDDNKDVKLLISNLIESNENLGYNQHIITLAISELKEDIKRIEEQIKQK